MAHDQPFRSILEKCLPALNYDANTRPRNCRNECTARGVDGEAPLLTAVRHEGAVSDLDVEAEAALHLVAPLEAEGRGADDEVS